MEKLFEIVHEDASLLVINKPAGLVCHPTKGDAYSSLISRVRLHLGTAAHLVNRLDRETSGVTLVAKDAASNASLKKLFAERAVQKEYLALVHGHVTAERGAVDAPLGRDEASLSFIKDRVRADGAAARTEFGVERRFMRAEGAFTLLRVRPKTGRKHQIRLHLAHLGHPIVGDKIYGGDEKLYLDFALRRLSEAQRERLLLPCHALHAESLRFVWRSRDWHFWAEPEKWFRDFAEGEPCRPDWTDRYL